MLIILEKALKKLPDNQQLVKSEINISYLAKTKVKPKLCTKII